MARLRQGYDRVVNDPFDQIQPELLRLFSSVEVDPQPDFDQTEPFVLVGFGPTLLFRGPSLELLRALQAAMAESALARGGPSRKAAETLLTSACVMSVVDGRDEAIAWIKAELAEPPTRWAFVESIGAYLPKDELHLGSCRLALEPPSEVVPEPVEPRLREHLAPPLILVEVDARDQESARLLARDRIDEAVAILALAAGYRGTHAKHALAQRGGTTSLGGGPGVMIAAEFWDAEGRVHPHYRAMSDAAARTDEERTDWERRVLASARWFGKAAATFWPSEALTAAMTALECLFVKDRKTREKGAAIAESFTQRFVARGWSADQQRDWLRGLYRARNDAIHEGRRFVEDLDVDRLVDLTAYAVRWGAWHLSPDHDNGTGACHTFDAVMGHDLQRSSGG
jgi:Apea-like HEPN